MIGHHGVSPFVQHRLGRFFDVADQMSRRIGAGIPNTQIRSGPKSYDRETPDASRSSHSRSDECCRASPPDAPEAAPCHRAQRILPALRPSTPSSVAIHCTPRLLAIANTSSETLPSDGHIPLGRTPKTFSMQVKTANQLLARIFRMAKSVLRQRQPGRRDCPGIRIAHQRQNRMIERCCRNFDGTRLRRVGMRRQHPASNSRSRAITKLLIVQRVVVSFLDQRRDIWIFQKEFVKPCDLRKHLQIGEVLRLEISFRPLRMIARARETAPTTRDSADNARSNSAGSPETGIAAQTAALHPKDPWQAWLRHRRNGSCAVPAT